MIPVSRKMIFILLDYPKNSWLWEELMWNEKVSVKISIFAYFGSYIGIPKYIRKCHIKHLNISKK